MSTSNGGDDGGNSNDRLILLFLGSSALVSIIGLTVLAVFKVDAQPLVAIASAAIGAMATKVTRGSSGDGSSRHSKDEDDFAILGRAATKSIIAEAMRQMGAKE